MDETVNETELWPTHRLIDSCDADAFPTAEVGALGYEVAAHGTGRWNGVALLSRVGLDDVRRGLPDEPGFPDPEPRADEHRGNIHVGGTCIKAEVTPRDREICRELAPRLRQDGLYFVGLDIIGDYLTEVNVTSPTGVQEIDALDNVRLEAEVLDFVERRVEERRRQRL